MLCLLVEGSRLDCLLERLPCSSYYFSASTKYTNSCGNNQEHSITICGDSVVSQVLRSAENDRTADFIQH